MEAPAIALVTGAGGFVGANLVRRLLAEGHAVHAVTRPGSRPWRLEGLPDVRYVEVDLGDAQAVGSVVERLAPDRVFHLAAHGAYSWQTDVQEMVRTNVTGTIALVDACLAVGCGVLVNAGSSSEYGFKDHAPSERELPEPNGHYAVTKVAGTLYCTHAGRNADTTVVTLRLYSVYGPWEQPGRLMPTLAALGLRGRLPALANPAVARDFVHVDDVVDAFLLAASASSPSGAVYNVGTGRQTSLEEVVALARRVFELDAEPRWGSNAGRSWDTNVWVADPARVRGELGWGPEHDLDSGLRRLAQWLQSHPGLIDRYVAAAG